MRASVICSGVNARGRTADAAPGAGGVEALAGAFDDLLALELGDRGEHGEDQFAGHVVAGVEHDAVDGAEVPAVGVQVVFDDREEVVPATGSPVTAT
jgi:hypothetical protein